MTSALYLEHYLDSKYSIRFCVLLKILIPMTSRFRKPSCGVATELHADEGPGLESSRTNAQHRQTGR